MSRAPRMFTKRTKILGLPIGRRRTDWRKVGKVGAAGLGVATSVAGTLGAKRAGSALTHRVSEAVRKPLEKGKETLSGAKTAGDEVGAIGKAMSAAKTPFGKIAAGFKAVGGDGGGGEGENLKKLRLIIKESIDVAVPRSVAYNQWTQFEELSSILKGVGNVTQEDDDVLNWSVKIGPSRRQWRARITEQTPDERIVWESADGTENRGVITFHSLDSNLTRVQVEMEYFPRGPIEKIGNIFLAARRRVRKDLRLFKHYMELAGEETGAWRGEIAKDEEPEDRDDEQARDEDVDEQARDEAEAQDAEQADDEDAAEAEESPNGQAKSAETAEDGEEISVDEDEPEPEHAESKA